MDFPLDSCSRGHWGTAFTRFEESHWNLGVRFCGGHIKIMSYGEQMRTSIFFSIYTLLSPKTLKRRFQHFYTKPGQKKNHAAVGEIHNTQKHRQKELSHTTAGILEGRYWSVRICDPCILGGPDTKGGTFTKYHGLWVPCCQVTAKNRATMGY